MDRRRLSFRALPVQIREKVSTMRNDDYRGQEVRLGRYTVRRFELAGTGSRDMAFESSAKRFKPLSVFLYIRTTLVLPTAHD